MADRFPSAEKKNTINSLKDAQVGKKAKQPVKAAGELIRAKYKKK